MALCFFSLGMIWEKARREASSMQTWTNSQPMPRLLLWPVRSPVMRWPMRSKRPSFLMSMWIISLALVAADRLDRVKRLQLVQPKPFENPADGGRRDAGCLGDLLAGPALAAQDFDLPSAHRRGWPGEAMRPRGAIDQAGAALGRAAFDPLADGLGRHPHGGGYGHGRLACNQHPAHQLGST